MSLKPRTKRILQNARTMKFGDSTTRFRTAGMLRRLKKLRGSMSLKSVNGD